MKLVNYQEDLVLHVAEIVLQDRPDVELSQELLMDAAAYTLNRLTPRYIVSERGFTRLMAAHWFDEDNDGEFNDLVGLLLLVNRAIDVVKDRRHPDGSRDGGNEAVEEEDHVEPHWHNIPYVIGRVVGNDASKPIADVKITQFVDGELVNQAKGGWTNPYLTNSATKGFYSFLPAPIHSEERKRRFVMKLVFEHADFARHEVDHQVKTHGEIAARLDFRNDGLINLGTTVLTT
ncbi:MAG: late competence development ComFB family protein [Spirochaetales bacterium]|jgi:hypothetical protein|nr:late competence development ComFB family protein [Spirochaetales bacterium]